MKKNSKKHLRNIFKITLKFLTRPVLPHITVLSQTRYSAALRIRDLFKGGSRLESGVIPTVYLNVKTDADPYSDTSHQKVK